MNEFKLPKKTMVIASCDIDLRVMDKLEDNDMAQYYIADGHITIRRGIQHQVALQCVWHAALNIGLWTGGLHALSSDDFTDVVSAGVCSVLRHNPALRRHDAFRKLPKVRIGTSEYEVHYTLPENWPCIGVCFNSPKREIVVAKSLKGDALFDVVWHELVHAMFYGVRDGHPPEDEIHAATSCIVQVLRDNPFMSDASLWAKKSNKKRQPKEPDHE